MGLLHIQKGADRTGTSAGQEAVPPLICLHFSTSRVGGQPPSRVQAESQSKGNSDHLKLGSCSKSPSEDRHSYTPKLAAAVQRRKLVYPGGT